MKRLCSGSGLLNEPKNSGEGNTSRQLPLIKILKGPVLPALGIIKTNMSLFWTKLYLWFSYTFKVNTYTQAIKHKLCLGYFNL